MKKYCNLKGISNNGKINLAEIEEFNDISRRRSSLFSLKDYELMFGQKLFKEHQEK